MFANTKNNKGFIAGLLTAAAASLCCIAPALAFLGGASGLAASFSWIEPYRPYLIGLTILVFAFAWYQQLKPQKQADCNCDTSGRKSFLQSKKFLGLITIVAALLIAFPNYAGIFYPKPKQAQPITGNLSSMQQAMFSIKGMTCTGCTEHVNSELAKLAGVKDFKTSFEQANSVVCFDQNKTSVDSIAAAINNTGYKVVAQHIINN